MTAMILQLTDAGIAAVQATIPPDRVIIAQMGLSDTPFDAAPTLPALPGEFKRLDALTGQDVAPNIAHITAYDTSTDIWAASGLGLFLEDGTLFATYSAESAIISKAANAFALIACDLAFADDIATNITFGAPIFDVPPATTEMRGIVEMATTDEVRAGTDPLRAVTPAGLGAVLPVGFGGVWYGVAADVPAGWAICDGRTVPRSDGSDTITTPDMAADATRLGLACHFIMRV